MAEIKMVVGLGNPGKKHSKTRHNAGFWAVDSLAEQLGIRFKTKKFGAYFGTGEYLGKKLILLKPLQFMNCSGQVVATAVGFYKLELSDLLVISDDMALEAGRIRIRLKGSGGGQKGLADIIDKLGTNEFSRLRIGIGQNESIDAYDYVLSEPTREERKLLDGSIERAKEAVLCWIEHEAKAAMNGFNCVED
ncbi:MAG: aminoacyl-tRNA hydrolase [Planctomycetota bacterium]|jgi:PTH1 family peptidyl-tRNA hydrolase